MTVRPLRSAKIYLSVWLSFCLALAVSVQPAFADTIFLKNGQKIEVEKAWEENGQVRAHLYGVRLSYPLEQVEKIDRLQADATAVGRDRFKVDIWSSGMGYDAIRRQAEESGIQIRHLPKVSDMQLPDGVPAGPDTEKIKRILYNEVLLGQPAEIELVLTQDSRKLYQLNVVWKIVEDKLRTEFATKVAGNLVTQYGQPSKKRHKLLSTMYKWNNNRNHFSVLSVKAGIVKLSYFDKELQQLARAEKRQ